jgi:hypothetical protein
MGEKGNAVEAVSTGAAGLGERAATVASGTTADVVRKARDEAVGAATGAVISAAGGRLRRDKSDKGDKGDDSESTGEESRPEDAG